VNDHSLNGGGEDESYFLYYVSHVARVEPNDRFPLCIPYMTACEWTILMDMYYLDH
jgi:hypothetical protein